MPLFAQDDVWCLVMTKEEHRRGELWKKSNDFPKEKIRAGWDDDKYITHISYDNGQWILTMQDGVGYYSQTWTTRFEFPKERIREGWNEDKYITSLSYEKDVWVLVMSKGTGYTGQTWATNADFPKEEIQEGWDENKYITSLSYGNGMWTVVMSKGAGYESQMWRTRTYFPKKEIREGWEDGKYITSLTYGDGMWALVMSKGSTEKKQLWHTNSDFPKDKIDKSWDKDYNISTLSYGPKQEDDDDLPAPVVTPSEPSIPIANSTIHFILFTDTDDSRVGTSCEETNRYFQNNFVPKLQRYTGMNVETYYNSGSGNFTVSKLNSIISNLSTRSNDVIFFYYAGHGYNRDYSDYPTITLGMSGEPIAQRRKDLISIYNSLKQKNHRLLVVMAEACNKVYARRNDMRTSQVVGNYNLEEDESLHFKELFVNSSGNYLMSSSSKNQLSHLATGQPGFFTCGFRDAFAYYTDVRYSGVTTWEKVFNKTKNNTYKSAQEIGEIQEPQWCTGNCY